MPTDTLALRIVFICSFILITLLVPMGFFLFLEVYLLADAHALGWYQENPFLLYSVYALVFLLNGYFSIVMMHYVSRSFSNLPASWLDSALAVVVVYPAVLVIGLFQWGAILLGTLPLIFFGPFFYDIWFVAVPAYVVERQGVQAAFWRSWELSFLSRGLSYHLFGVLLIIAFFSIAICAHIATGTPQGPDGQPAPDNDFRENLIFYAFVFLLLFRWLIDLITTMTYFYLRGDAIDWLGVRP